MPLSISSVLRLGSLLARSSLLVTSLACSMAAEPVGDDPGAPDAGAPGPGGGTGAPGGGGGSGSGSADAPAGCQWHTTAIGTTMWSKTSNLALAVSSTGARAVAFTAGLSDHRDLLVARSSATGFVTQPYGFQLLTNLSYDTVAAAFAPDGGLRVAYGNQDGNSSTVGGVYYTTGPGVNVFIDGGGLFGYASDPDLAISADGRAHIAYSVSTPPSDRRIAVATSNGTGFTIAPALIDPALEGQANLALDAQGRAHVGSLDEPGAGVYHAVYANEAGSGWSLPSIVTNDAGFLSGASLAVSANGTVHVTRQFASRIVHASGTAAAWTITSIPHDSLYIVADYKKIVSKVDPTGQLHVAWSDAAGKVWYEAVGSRTPMPVLDSGQRIWDMTLAFGPDGPHLALAVGANDLGSPVKIYDALCEARHP